MTARAFQWAELEKALGYLHLGQSAYRRGDVEGGDVCMDDLRGCLGALALSLADGPDAEGYARLLTTVTSPPPTVRSRRAES